MPGLKKYNFLNHKTIYSLTTIALMISGNAFSQAPLQFPTQWEQTSVSKITIVGNKTVTNEAILNLMMIKVGTKLTQTLVSNDIKSIFGSSYFQDVKIDKTSNNELIISVVEKPTVNDIFYEGFDIVSASSIKDKILLQRILTTIIITNQQQ